ncbi:MAG TPA: high-potential iron-sulfur protein, partial [Rhizomicrobium sp.]|nr:high-potential iron-sulfur protein [Rhizomicrobium sp.]
RHAAAIATGVAATLAMIAPSYAKMTQKAAGYQATPNKDQKCSGCALFKSPDSCSFVDGTVSPDGWCRFFAKK